jgi:hypothetical protein
MDDPKRGRGQAPESYASDFAATKARRGTGIALVRISRKLLTEAFWALKGLEEPSH